MAPDREDEGTRSGSMLSGWMPLVRAVCEVYEKLPNEIAKLTLDQLLLLGIKKGLLTKQYEEPGWSFEGNVEVMDGGRASAKDIKGAVKRKDKSLFQQKKEDSEAARAEAEKPKRRRRRRRGR